MPNFNITIVSADKITVQETNETILSVQYSIFEINEKGEAVGEAVFTGREGFALGSTEEEVIEGIRKNLDAFTKDKHNAIRNEAHEEAEKETNEVIESIVGMEIAIDAENDKKVSVEVEAEITSEEIKN